MGYRTGSKSLAILHTTCNSNQKALMVVTGRDGATVRFTFSNPKTPINDLDGGYRAGVHLFPFRTEKLSPAPPMILR